MNLEHEEKPLTSRRICECNVDHGLGSKSCMMREPVGKFSQVELQASIGGCGGGLEPSLSDHIHVSIAGSAFCDNS